MRLTFLALPLVFLTACGGPLDLLTGGGPNVAANVQAGRTNSQTVGTTENLQQKIVRPQARDIRQSKDTNKVQSDSVSSITINEIPAWVILLLVIGWLFPSPGEIANNISKWWTNKKG